MLLTGIDRYNAEAMKELDSERDDILRQLGIESSLESTFSQLINPLEQMFSFLPKKKTGRRHKGHRQRRLENIHRPQNTQNAPNAVEIPEP